MHQSVLDFVARSLSHEEVNDKRVLEVGSYDVNGSLRPLVERFGPRQYLGSDMRPGPGVDLVVDIATADLGKFDIVCSAGTLEHMEDWRGCICSMKRHLSPDGLLFLTTVSPGFPLHDFPSDYWRFTICDMANIFQDMHFLALEHDPMVPGVFVKARKTAAPERELDSISVYAMVPH